MNQSINYKHKIEFNYTYKKRIRCSECNKKRTPLDESHQICHVCYKAKDLKLSGNKIIDDFIKYTQTNYIKKVGKLEFVPYDQFKNIEFIAEGGFSKIYKAIWIDGPVTNYNKKLRQNNSTVVLKKLNNSKNITSKELNELKVYYDFSIKCNEARWGGYVSQYYGITQDPVTNDMMIIIPYYYEGDLIRYITKDFYSINWLKKFSILDSIISGLKNIHSAKIVHRDLHSGNVFFGNSSGRSVRVGDLGISKSATDSTGDTDDNNENYGIIPYMAPEIFLGQKYTAASDIYSFGMIMWEVMTGRRPFWDRNHDTDLIIEILDGLRPPIVTNVPEGYIELMKKCWHSDPKQRPTATDIREKIMKIYRNEENCKTKIIESPDIGPVTINNPGATYKSRPLSGMIHSAMSLRSSSNKPIDKRKFVNNLTGDNDNEQSIKRKKLLANEKNALDRLIIEITETELNNEYTTRENDFDIE